MQHLWEHFGGVGSEVVKNNIDVKLENEHVPNLLRIHP